MGDDFKRVEVESIEALRAWLAEHYTQDEAVWLVVFKKHTGERYIPWGEVVDELLCYGWIDSRTRRLDADRTMLRISPRKPGSIWSRLNKDKVERLLAEGRMRPPGQAKIDAAMADGSWTFLDDVEALSVPDDLAAALEADPAAKRGYDNYNDSVKKNALYWLKTAKRAATRQRRIEAILARARQGRHPTRPGG
jgi:uncharacterized protein YdeI (YjbR/CyaY-like superfamily)